ncbi:unnamed protein product, partial [marine sediment metagenome]
MGDMVPNNYQSNIFEYTWNGIQAATSWMTGDSVEIVFNLTDIFENSNEYRYNFTADFISPRPIIKIGDTGTENYQDLLVANPFTNIEFINNTVTPSGGIESSEDVPTQPEDFSVLKGSSDWSG